MSTTKITGLSAMNVAAIRELSGDPAQIQAYGHTLDAHAQEAVHAAFPDVLEVTATTATFDGDPATVHRALQTTIDLLPGRAHPKASLHAVRRRVHALEVK